MIGFGGDGDSRLMKAMRVSVLLLTPAQDPLHGNQPNYSPCAALPKSWNKWFCIVQKPVLFVQDTVHLAVKLKSRLLNPNVTLKMGPNCEAGTYHLVTLHTKFGKEEYFLRERYINHKDRQNCDAVMHIINAALLLDRITGAAATKCYIELIQNITDSYLDKSLDPIARVENIWYANFFICSWRQWILLHPQFTLRSNFTTHNCYMCVELNAHVIIVYIMLIKGSFP